MMVMVVKSEISLLSMESVPLCFTPCALAGVVSGILSVCI